MIKVSVFICFVVAAVCSLYGVALTPPGKNPFTGKDSLQLIDLSVMASPTVACLKLRHADDHAPFALGLFGNSRILMISARAVDRSPEQFFNFALSSESLSGSVLLAERLETMGRLPKTLVFGLDNLHLQRDNVPIWPSFWTRITHAANMALSALADGAVITATRRTWRFLWGEAVRFDSIFGPTLLQAGVARIINDTALASATLGTGGYRSDGSQAHTTRAAITPAIGHTTSRLDLALFRQNLETLGALAAAGHNVILIETPIYPDSQRQMNETLPDYVRASRIVWHDTCRSFGLNCIDAPLIADTPSDPWYDSTHAPARPWAQFIAKAISQASAGAKN
tara:strand:+ start:196 stop:1215 length:1020 start_codon:yes stop_codon:yes gene_type:complete